MVIPFMKLASRLGISPLGAYHSMMYGKSMYFDITKAQKELKWEPKYSNKEMIIESYNYYIRHRASILNNNNKTSFHKGPVRQGILNFINWII